MGEFEEAEVGEWSEQRCNFKAAVAASCESSRLSSVSGSEPGDRRLRFTDGSSLTASA